MSPSSSVPFILAPPCAADCTPGAGVAAEAEAPITRASGRMKMSSFSGIEKAAMEFSKRLHRTAANV
jgi:hypothetical protein